MTLLRLGFMNSYGFTPREWDQIQEMFLRFPDVQRVLLFGSRALGKHTKGSDVDIVLFGDLQPRTRANLRSEFEKSTLPYFFDVLEYSTIDSPELKEHIDRHGVSIFEAKK